MIQFPKLRWPRSDEAEVAAEKKWQESAALINAYSRVFCSTDDGKKVLSDLRRYCGADDICFVADNNMATAFQLGARSVYLYIMDRVNDNPERYLNDGTDDD